MFILNKLLVSEMNLNKLLLLLVLLFASGQTTVLFAQDQKGDLSGFAEDFEEDDEDEDNDDSDSGISEFFFWAMIENLDEFASLWGKTPGTEYGPYPGFPYSVGNGFMTNGDDFRSFFFTTELSYHYINDDLRSYLFKWETEFVNWSKLSFDLAVYEEQLFAPSSERLRQKDYLTLMGLRYGVGIWRTPHVIFNIEGGYRSLNFNSGVGGPEIAVDFQFFPKMPLVIETKLSAAYVKRSPLYIVEASAGLAIGRLELLAGMRLMANKDLDVLNGFKLGLRLWY